MTDEEMDNFVLAVLPKKTAAKMQKELQDLVKKKNYVVNLFWYICGHEKCLLMYLVTLSSLRRPSSVLINVLDLNMIYLAHLLC